MTGNGTQSVAVAPADRAVQRFGSVGVDAVDGHLDGLHGVGVPVQSQLDDGVEGDVDVGDLLEGSLQEVAEDAAEDGLMGDGQDVGLALELSEDRDEAFDHVYVRLALGIAVGEFVGVAERQLFGEVFLELFVGETFAVTLEGINVLIILFYYSYI